MFLRELQNRNESLIHYVKELHQKGLIQPDTFVLDVDHILENAKEMKKEADLYGIKLFFMLKQIGRNPVIAKELVNMGYPGAVVVDYREGLTMMEHNIPICHAGHLVQIPHGLLRKFIQYGVDYITVYSMEKVLEINEICEELKIEQSIFLKVVNEKSLIYPSQESGFEFQQLDYVIPQIMELKGIKLAGVTAFPAFLYKEENKEIVQLENGKLIEDTAKYIEHKFGLQMERNMPSCSQKNLLKTVKELGGTQAEPGNSFTGTTPNNKNGFAAETPAMLYVTEVSHNFRGKSYCYGGGIYRRGCIEQALVYSKEQGEYVPVIMPNADNIDYYFALEKELEVSSTVIMSFRAQIFDTRSQVALVKGLKEGKPEVIGIYDSLGRKV